MAEVRRESPFLNDGERRVVRALAQGLPAEDVIITNFHLQQPSRKDYYEVDALVVSRHGVSVLEIKDWHGPLSFTGKKVILPSGKSRPDPRILLSDKAKQLRSMVRDLLPPSFDSIVVSTEAFLVMARNDIVIRERVGGPPIVSITDVVGVINGDQERSYSQAPLLGRAQIRCIADMLLKKSSDRRTVGEYLLVSSLGRCPHGSFEEFKGIELARDENHVRLKRYRLDQLADDATRDKQHAIAVRHFEALRKLQGKRLVSVPLVYGCFTDPSDDANFWTAYEWVDGNPLCEQSWSYERRLNALRRIAQTLATCHAGKVVHRALTPDCLIVPADGVPRILHFDFARILDRNTTIGTAVALQMARSPYAAPELRSLPFDAGSPADVYSLGRIAESLLKDKPLPPIVARMVYEDPEQRPTMTEVADAI